MINNESKTTQTTRTNWNLKKQKTNHIQYRAYPRGATWSCPNSTSTSCKMNKIDFFSIVGKGGFERWMSPLETPESASWATMLLMIEIDLDWSELRESKQNLSIHHPRKTQHAQIFQCANCWCRNPQHKQHIKTNTIHFARNPTSKLIPKLA